MTTPAADSVTPLCSPAQFTQGPFGGLVSQLDPALLLQKLIESTRLCEDVCDRRLAPFVNLVETVRADMLDVEDALDAYVPLDPTSQLGFSRAMSLGSTLLVRHFWVREKPPRYPEMWGGSITSINLLRSFSGIEEVDVSQIQYEPDTGHVRFQLGTFVPPGTTLQYTYSGGYTVATPASLVTANESMAAWLIVRQFDPQSTEHDPAQLYTDALMALDGYMRTARKA
jgi:hypothetical protein